MYSGNFSSFSSIISFLEVPLISLIKRPLGDVQMKNGFFSYEVFFWGRRKSRIMKKCCLGLLFVSERKKTTWQQTLGTVISWFLSKKKIIWCWIGDIGESKKQDDRSQFLKFALRERSLVGISLCTCVWRCCECRGAVLYLWVNFQMP